MVCGYKKIFDGFAESNCCTGKAEVYIEYHKALKLQWSRKADCVRLLIQGPRVREVT